MLLAAGVALYSLVRHSLVAEVDRALLAKARQRDEYLEPWGFHEVPDEFQHIRHAAKVWLDVSPAAQADGDGDRALECCTNALWMNRTLDANPSVITALVRAAVDALGCTEIEGALSRCRLSTEALDQIQRALLTEADAMNPQRAYTGEIVLLAELCERYEYALAQQTKALVQSTWQPQSWFTEDPPSPAQVRRILAGLWAWQWLYPGHQERFHARAVREKLEVLDMLATPVPELAEFLRHIDDDSDEFHDWRVTGWVLRTQSLLRVTAAGVGPSSTWTIGATWRTRSASSSSSTPTVSVRGWSSSGSGVRTSACA